MVVYNFYFDESAHTRAITYIEDKGLNIYIEDKDKQNDLFVGFFWGINENLDLDFEHRFVIVENYIKELLGLKENQEFKGDTIKTDQFRNGFNSLGKINFKIYKVLFEMLDEEDLILHIHLLSKTEYMVREFFKEINLPTEFLVAKQALMYTLTKFFFNYRKQDLLEKMYSNNKSVSEKFIYELKNELEAIVEHAKDISRMKYEVKSFKELLICLTFAELNVAPKVKYLWDYEPLFIGFSNLLRELNISNEDVNLRIDPEGANEIFRIASKQDFRSVKDDLDSNNSSMIRIADIFSNFFYKFSYNLYLSLKETEYTDVYVRDFSTKRLLDEKWFDIKREDVYLLYVQANKIFESRKSIYWTTFSGIYADYALLTFSLLSYIGGQYKSFKDFHKYSPIEHTEIFNKYAALKLMKFFDNLKA